jgi:hypothetical protein
MRPLLLTVVLIIACAATFLTLAALGTLGLNRRPAVVIAPSQLDGGAVAEPTDDASQTSAKIPANVPAKGEPAAAPLIDPPIVRADARPAQRSPIAGPIDLPALGAVTHGRSIRVEPIPGGYAVSGWRDPEAYVEWDLAAAAAAAAAPAPGRYRVELSFACPPDAGGRFVLSVGDDALPGQARPTGGADQYRTTTLGSVRLRPGDTRLTLKPDGRIRGAALMNLRAVRLVPA